MARSSLGYVCRTCRSALRSTQSTNIQQAAARSFSSTPQNAKSMLPDNSFIVFIWEGALIASIVTISGLGIDTDILFQPLQHSLQPRLPSSTLFSHPTQPLLPRFWSSPCTVCYMYWHEFKFESICLHSLLCCNLQFRTQLSCYKHTLYATNLDCLFLFSTRRPVI